MPKEKQKKPKQESKEETKTKNIDVIKTQTKAVIGSTSKATLKRDMQRVNSVFMQQLDQITIQMQINAGNLRIYPEQFDNLMCKLQDKTIYQDTQDSMHLCALFVAITKSVNKRKLDWLQKKDLPTSITSNIINNNFILTVQCPNNIPLFKLIVKTLIQELADQENYRDASNIIKATQPEFFRIRDSQSSEKQIKHYLFMKLNPSINILFGRNKDKIEAFIPYIHQIFESITVPSVVSQIKTVKYNQKTTEDTDRVSKYRKIDFPFTQDIIQLLFIMAIDILQFDYYFTESAIFVKRNIIPTKDLKLIAKFIKYKLMFLTEKTLVPYEKRTKYYQSKFTKEQYQLTLSKYKDKHIQYFMQTLMSQSFIDYKSFVKIFEELHKLQITEQFLDDLKEKINRQL